MHAATAVLVGLGVGLHAAIWGVFKDSPHEGFHWSRFVRSPVDRCARGAGALCARCRGRRRGRRRAAVRCGVRGGAVHHRDVEDVLPHRGPVEVHDPDAARGPGSAGAECVSAMDRWASCTSPAASACWSRCAGWGATRQRAWPLLVLAAQRRRMDQRRSGAPGRMRPIEGFETFKFFRSPSVALSYALLLSRLTHRSRHRDAGCHRPHRSPPSRPGRSSAVPIETGRQVRRQAGAFPPDAAHRFRFVPLYVTICTVVALLLLSAVYSSRTAGCMGCESAVLLSAPVTGRLP